MTILAALLLALPPVSKPLQVPPHRPKRPESHELQLDVRLPGGARAENAVVIFHDGGDRRSSTIAQWKSPEEPVRLFAESGTLRVYLDPVEMPQRDLPGQARAQRPNYARFDGELIAPFVSLPLKIDLKGRDEGETLRIDLRPSNYVRVTVKPAEGEALPKELIAKSFNLQQARSAETSRQGMGRVFGRMVVPTFRARGNVIEIYRLKVGEERQLSIGVKGRIPLAQASVTPKEGVTEISVALRPALEGSIRYRVIGLPEPENSPVGTSVRRYARSADGGRRRVIDKPFTVSDDDSGAGDGSGWQRALLGPDDARFAGAEWLGNNPKMILAVERSGYGVVAQHVDFMEPEMTFRFKSPVEVSVQLEGEHRENLLYLLTPIGMRDVAASTATSLRQLTPMGAVQPGRYLFEVVRPRSGKKPRPGSGLLLQAQEVEIPHVLEHVIELTLPACADLYVASTAVTADRTLQLVPVGVPDTHASDRSTSARLDSEGRARFRGVPAGRYEINSGRWYRRLTIRASDGATAEAPVRFEPEKSTVARVNLSAADGAMWEAGLQDGDLVVGVDGALFASPEEAWGIILRARKGPLELMLRRGKQDLALEFGPTGFGTSMGGALSPYWGD